MTWHTRCEDRRSAGGELLNLNERVYVYLTMPDTQAKTVYLALFITRPIHSSLSLVLSDPAA